MLVYNSWDDCTIFEMFVYLFQMENKDILSMQSTMKSSVLSNYLMNLKKNIFLRRSFCLIIQLYLFEKEIQKRKVGYREFYCVSNLYHIWNVPSRLHIEIQIRLINHVTIIALNGFQMAI